jgi:hypothetical protein
VLDDESAESVWSLAKTKKDLRDKIVVHMAGIILFHKSVLDNVNLHGVPAPVPISPIFHHAPGGSHEQVGSK